MNFRKQAFHLLRKNDSLIISENISNLSNHLLSPNKINEEKLNNFINIITKESEYYKSYSFKKITEFPIMDKKILSNNINRIKTINESDFKNHFTRSTSGSYGTPFKFIVNKSKILSQQAQVIFFGNWSNFDIGIKHLYLKSINPNIINQITKNQYVLKPEKINNQWVTSAIKKLIKVRPEVLIGYPSSLESIAQEINKNNYSFPFVKGIITSGESLTEDASDEIFKAFKVKPLSRYSTEELGVLGNTLKNGNNIVLNQVDFLIEILDSNNNPVKEGEIGKVIVTDFNSHIIPLIRYDTGDLAKVARYEKGLVTEIEHLEGRLIETIFTTNGDMITPFSINAKMKGYENVQQFQFVQESHKKYILKIVPIKIPKENEYQDILKHYNKILGEDAEVILEIVEEIQSLPSGKRPYIINKLLKSNKN